MPLNSIRIVVTGEHEDLETSFPGELGHEGKALEWVSVPVLHFDRLPVDGEQVKRLLENPPDWILFTSPRSVHFWVDTLMELGLDFPIETQVACIGARTAEAANGAGFTPDFYPTEPGSEKFLEEFEDMISNTSLKPTVLIPMAEKGRALVGEELTKLGCRVEKLALYRSRPRSREEMFSRLQQKELEDTTLILFTSPSSVDAFSNVYEIPEHVRVGSIGSFTSSHLQQKGFKDTRILPQGDFERIGELLC